MNGEITLNEIVEKYGIDISIKDVVALEFQEGLKADNGSIFRSEVNESDTTSKFTAVQNLRSVAQLL